MPATPSGETTGALGLAGRRRWIVQIEGRGLHLVESDAELRDLVRQRRVTFDSRLYEVRSTSCTVGDLLAVARPLPAEPDSEPPIRADTRSRERIQLSEELAILDRPLDDDIEYYDEVPRARAKEVLAFIALLALAAGGAYKWAPRYLHLPGADAARVPETSGSPSPPTMPVAARAGTGVVTPRPTPAPPRVEEPPRRAQPPEHAAADMNSTTEPPTDPIAAPSSRGPDQAHSGKSYEQLVGAADRLLENGRRRHAEDLYQKALAVRSGGAEALTGLGYCELDRGRAPKAISLFKQALARHASHAPALFGLGEAYREQGQPAMALQAFKRYLSLAPSGRDADMARRQIRQLGS